MTAKERLAEAGYEDIIIFENCYDDALIGVSHDERAIYDFDKMVEYLVEKEGFTDEEAIEWIEFNTLRALPYFGEKAPIILYRLEE